MDIFVEEYGKRKSGWIDSEPEDDSFPEIECDLDCPLRKPYSPVPDPALPQPEDSLPLTHAEACVRLYGTINPWQTRLLVIEPGNFGTSISASLVVVDLVYSSGAVLHERQHRVQYAAVSYTWGASSFPRRIQIKGIMFPVTENAYAFIQRHRSTHALWYVWIDAICINQSDLDEKAVQVDHMLVIYEKAELVMVWLGEEGPTTKLVVDYLHWATSKEREARDAKRVLKGHSKKCLQLVSQVLGGIEDICSRSWIRRMWIKQEVWAAKRLTVCCGTHQLTWEGYHSASSTVIAPTKRVAQDVIEVGSRREQRQFRPDVSSSDNMCLQSLRTRSESLGDPGTSYNNNAEEIMALLNGSVDCHTTNAHDRIYGLLGMAGIHHPGEQGKPASHAMTIEIDYKISLEVLYSRFAMSIMLHAGPQFILATDGIYGDGLDLPSWTPDFRYRTRRMRSFWPTHPAKHKPAQISTRPPESGERLVRRFRELNKDVSSSILKLEGCHIATILFTTPEEEKVLELKRMIFTESYSDSKVHPKVHPRFVRVKDSPFVKPMAAQPAEWTVKFMEQQPLSRRNPFVPHYNLWATSDNYQEQFPGRRPLSNAILMRYLHDGHGFAVPNAAEPGDAVILVGAVGAPMILRPTCVDPARYKFVGCVHFMAFSFARDDELWDLGDELKTGLGKYVGVGERTQIFEVG